MPLRFDSTQVVLREYDASKMASYRSSPDFQYDEQAIPISAWERFKQWWRQLWRSVVGASGGRVLDYALAALGVIALIYLLIKLAGMDNGNIFSRRAGRNPLQHAEVDENIHALDFDAELMNAVTQRNYRVAIRLLYLQCLKRLADQNLIDWKPAKTNAHYQQELQGGPHESAFKALTYQYEYSWYGDFPVGPEHFEAVRADFEQFDQEVHA